MTKTDFQHHYFQVRDRMPFVDHLDTAFAHREVLKLLEHANTRSSLWYLLTIAPISNGSPATARRQVQSKIRTLGFIGPLL